jgi:hypothetical protein
MYCYFINRSGNGDLLLTCNEISEAGSLADTKLRTWDWNYAYGPDYKFHNNFILNNEKHAVTIFVKDGIIRECKIEGSAVMRNIGRKLIGCRHMPEYLFEILRGEGIANRDINVYNFF